MRVMRRSTLNLGLAMGMMLLAMSCTQRREDVERCVKSGGPFRFSDALIAYRQDGGAIDAGRAARVPGVVGITPFVLSEVALTSSPSATTTVNLRGIDFTSPVGRAVAANMVSGSVPTAEKNGTLIGNRLAQQHGLSAGDIIHLTIPSGAKQAQVAVVVSGVFRIGYGEYDELSAFFRVEDAMKILGLAHPTGMALETKTLDGATTARAEIAAMYGPDVRVRDWRDLNRRTLDALAKELGVQDVDAATLDARLPLICAALR